VIGAGCMGDGLTPSSTWSAACPGQCGSCLIAHSLLPWTELLMPLHCHCLWDTHNFAHSKHSLMNCGWLKTLRTKELSDSLLVMFRLIPYLEHHNLTVLHYSHML
jgi:hypothetical protein